MCDRSAPGKRGCAGKRWSIDRPGSDAPCKCDNRHSRFDHRSNSNFWIYVKTTCAFLVCRFCQLLCATLCCHKHASMWIIWRHVVRSQTDPKTLAGKAVICDEDLEGHISARYCCCAEHAEHPESACWAYSSWHRQYVLASHTPLCTQIVFTIVRTSTHFQNPGSTAKAAPQHQSRLN